ncbi:unnamed protein product [Agarophyton chilense]
MTLPPVRFNRTTFKFRRYIDANDRDQVKHICARVYNSRDYVPTLLPAYASGIGCEPFVLDSSEGVAAFIVVRHEEIMLEKDAISLREVYVDAVRVREDMRGVGVATTILSEATKLVRNSNLPSLRIISTTIPENKPMIRVFQKTGWKPVSNMIIWPKKDAIRCLHNTGRSMLESLNVVQKISTEATTLSSRWRRVGISEDIAALVRQLRSNESLFFRPGYFEAESLYCASSFLLNKLAEREQRSVWRLDCGENLVGLLFVRPQELGPTSKGPRNIISACVDDIHVAESVVVFGGNLMKEAMFHVSFDAGMNAEKMTSSPLLSSVESSPFIVYEHW